MPFTIVPSVKAALPGLRTSAERPSNYPAEGYAMATQSHYTRARTAKIARVRRARNEEEYVYGSLDDLRIEIDLLAPGAERITGKTHPVDIIARDVLFGEGP